MKNLLVIVKAYFFRLQFDLSFKVIRSEVSFSYVTFPIDQKTLAVSPIVRPLSPVDLFLSFVVHESFADPFSILVGSNIDVAC